MSTESAPFRRDSIEYAFSEMRSLPGFDASQPQLWGYFFTASSDVALKPVRELLKDRGYAHVSLDEGEEGLWWLSVSKNEVHSIDSLHAQNLHLYEISKQFPDVTYDGWDITAPAR